ncbi:PLD nuclease N-terminal domain-containing protein [Botryobacter ruber]|uniref:PLD nuclease N-terminal domain-containing protein n=1 Tax=Botryobacter ruber TaxID=2171629 RepID=UPI000E0A4915|nr:PLD nuclease N-terminal domain-containing protein [Botryobacter ruber]
METNNLLFVGGLGIPELILLVFFGVVPFLLLLWALIDVLRSTFKNSTEKLVWAVVIIFVPVLGPLLYLLIGRSQKVRHPL